MRKYLFIILFLLTNVSSAKNSISDYQRIFLPVYTSDAKIMLAIRVFKMNDIPSFLTVDPESLQTKVVSVADVKPRNPAAKNTPGYFAYWNIAKTRYYQLLNKTTAAPYVTENQGVLHAKETKEGTILTIDLCPSMRLFEAEFFKKLTQLSEQTHKPTPITIAISGMWLIQHPEEFQWLLTQEKENKLDITWANHSFSHIYYSDPIFRSNFLN